MKPLRFVAVLRVALAAFVMLSIGVAATANATQADVAQLDGSGVADASESFPCQWTWSIQPGILTGFIVAGNSANCTGIHGSLTLSTRLQEWNRAHRRWKTVRTQRKTWHHLGTTRSSGVQKRCDNGKYRAKFRWKLRDTSGRRLAHLALTKGAVVAPVGCRLTLG